jgi:hypothetical protein
MHSAGRPEETIGMWVFRLIFDLGVSQLGVRSVAAFQICVRTRSSVFHHCSVAVPRIFISVRLCEQSTQERPRTLSLLCRCLTRGFRGLFERLVIELMMCHLGQPLAYSARGTNHMLSSEYSAASGGRLSYNCRSLTVCALTASCSTALATALYS